MNIALSDLTLDKIGGWPKPIKILVCALLSILIFILGYIVDLGDIQDQLVSLELKQNDLKTTFEKKQQLAVNLEAYEAQIKTIKEYFGALLRQLPGSTEVPGLIEDISQAAVKNGLFIDSIKLQPENEMDFYSELPIEIVVIGSYHSLGQFVSDVSGLSRIVTLHDFSIAPSGNSLQMRMIAKTYRYTAENRMKKSAAKKSNTSKKIQKE